MYCSLCFPLALWLDKTLPQVAVKTLYSIALTHTNAGTMDLTTVVQRSFVQPTQALFTSVSQLPLLSKVFLQPLVQSLSQAIGQLV